MKKLITSIALLAAAIAVQAQYSLKRFEINTQPGFGNGSDPSGYTSFEGRTYFFADDGGPSLRQLWSTDGVSVRHEQAKGYMNLWYLSRPEMQVAGDKLYYAATDLQYGSELHQFGGGVSGVAIDLMPGSTAGDPNGANPRRLITANGKLYFYGGLWSKFGIWQYDPATSAAKRVVDPQDFGYMSLNTKFIPFRDKLIFAADDSLTGNEPFMLDLKTGLYNRLADINPGPAGSDVYNLVVYKDHLFFFAKTAANGYELYMYNGKGAPVRLTDIAPGAAGAHTLGVWDEYMCGFGDKMYFSAKSTSTTYDLYSYDIVLQQVKLEHTLNAYERVNDFVVYGSKLFFVDANYTLMVMDEDMAPIPVNTLNLGAPFYGVANLEVSHGRLFFSASNGNGDLEPYVLTDSIALGVQQTAVDYEVAAYPNPATSMVQIEVLLNENAVLHVVLTDMQGRTVYSVPGKSYTRGRHQITVPVQDLATGVYTYAVTGADGAARGRGQIIKQ